jgi:hypothetical protein
MHLRGNGTSTPKRYIYIYEFLYTYCTKYDNTFLELLTKTVRLQTVRKYDASANINDVPVKFNPVLFIVTPYSRFRIRIKMVWIHNIVHQNTFIRKLASEKKPKGVPVALSPL